MTMMMMITLQYKIEALPELIYQKSYIGARDLAEFQKIYWALDNK